MSDPRCRELQLSASTCKGTTPKFVLDTQRLEMMLPLPGIAPPDGAPADQIEVTQGMNLGWWAERLAWNERSDYSVERLVMGLFSGWKLPLERHQER